jgi:hypothetical protein
MGACFNTARFKGGSDKDLKSEWNRYVENLRYDHGHDPYSGTFATKNGLSVNDKMFFKTMQEAEQWLVEQTSKWDNPIAVKVFCPNKKFEETATGKKLKEAIGTANKAYYACSGNDMYDVPKIKAKEACGKAVNKFKEAELKYIDKQFVKENKKFIYFIGGWCPE